MGVESMVVRELGMASTHISLKRAYEPASADDGVRILVERLWPRGVTKTDAALDHWAKDIAPTGELRSWFGHRPERWRDFRTRYRRELNENQTDVNSLRDLCAGQRVTFIFAAKDLLRNGAVVLKEYLDARPRRAVALAPQPQFHQGEIGQPGKPGDGTVGGFEIEAGGAIRIGSSKRSVTAANVRA